MNLVEHPPWRRFVLWARLIQIGDPELLVTMSDSNKKERGPLSGWRDVENTHVASFRYDVTPSDYVKMIICEHGCVAPNSVASVLRTAAV